MLADVGTPVHYRGIGAGRIVDHRQRDFRGTSRRFAVIEFPHRDMTAQVPLGDPGVDSKVTRVGSADEVRAAIALIGDPGEKLQRTFEERDKTGSKRLRDGGPLEWASLLRDYAAAQSRGEQLAVSDVELIREAQEKLAAELACAAQEDYRQVLADLRVAYGKAALPEMRELVAA